MDPGSVLRVGIVANEPSGDILGASLIKAIRQCVPNASFEGVGGPEMISQGCNTLYPMERLSVMGLIEVLKHLPELLSIRKGLLRHFSDNPPDVFIGIDAPDFNLDLERKLKQRGIPTVHYVCPTVWAWRPKRVKKIRAAADLVLSIFPFEKEFLKPHGVNAAYVGHPLADDIAMDTDASAARKRLGLDPHARFIALLPGSRLSEIETLSADFLRAAAICAGKYPDLQFVVPLINQKVRERFEQILNEVSPQLAVTLVDGHSRDAMQAAELVLTASGTATLEALLLKRPMVVAYRLNRLTYWIVDTFNLVNVPYVSMANLLSEEPLAAEFIQDAVTPEALSGALIDLLDAPEKTAQIARSYARLHNELKQDAGARSAEAVLALVKKHA
ncbi:MAG: lipid-A-disaccharide synthase [Sedimenticola sp.]|nr:MAG: lipid-A-disaccharide synthase [Sedimenticola sp.]